VEAAVTELIPGFVFRGHTGRCVRSVTSHGEGEGLRLLSASEDGCVCVWDGKSEERLQHGGKVSCVKAFQDSEGRGFVASTGSGGVLKVRPPWCYTGKPPLLESTQVMTAP
jgi:WD40 repeat protein